MASDEEMAAIRVAKKELRKVMKEKLKQVDAQSVTAQCTPALRPSLTRDMC
jgi:hypothetical protein